MFNYRTSCIPDSWDSICLLLSSFWSASNAAFPWAVYVLRLWASSSFYIWWILQKKDTHRHCGNTQAELWLLILGHWNCSGEWRSTFFKWMNETSRYWSPAINLAVCQAPRGIGRCTALHHQGTPGLLRETPVLINHHHIRQRVIINCILCNQSVWVWEEESHQFALEGVKEVVTAATA